MRLVIIAAAAALIALPAGNVALACSGPSLQSAKTSLDLSAAAKKKKEKVEYMRSAAGPEPAPAKKKKKKN